MSNIFSTSLFSKPKYSKFSLSHDWKGSYEIGTLVPTYWRFVHPGERFIGRVEQLTRFAPMLAPIMHQFDVTLDWHFCPMRLLDVDSEIFFNLNKNSSYEKSLPSVKLYDVLRECVDKNMQGTLLDYFGYPILSNLVSANLPIVRDDELFSTHKLFVEYNTPLGVERVLTLKGFIHSYFVLDNSDYDFNDYVSSLKPEDVISSMDYYYYLNKFGFSEKHATDEYLKYLKNTRKVKSELSYKGSQDVYLSLLPFYAYWRIVSDWYVNPNYVDSEQFYKDKWKLLSDINLASSSSDEDAVRFSDSLVKPYLRNYASDYFTTSFLDTQSGNAVSIPTNGTVIDLRQANSIQKLRERALYAGKRYIDNVLAFFGVKSSDVRLDRTEVLARDSYKVNISAVTQTNQSDLDKTLDTPLGTYVGEGYSAGGRGKFDYTAEEHGVIMCMVSVRPKSSYMQGINPLLTKSKVTDFIIPDMSQIGEQSIPNCHLFCDYDFIKKDLNFVGTFGYTRRYAEFMFSPSETHGDFRTSMSYWHATRMFDCMPTVGAAFNEINLEHDNINRIFAVPQNVDHIYQYLYFDLDCVSPLPRYVNYDL